MIDYKKAGARIKEQRKTLGLTQEELSEKIQITPSFFSQIETGNRKAGINTFVKISQELSLPLDYIFDNNINQLSSDRLGNTERKIFHRLKRLSDKEKEFVLSMISLLEKYSS